jgi:hypothetical protein
MILGRKLKAESKPQMPNFLSEIEKLDTGTPPPARPPLESRRARRLEARNAAKNNQKLTKEKAGDAFL